MAETDRHVFVARDLRVQRSLAMQAQAATPIGTAQNFDFSPVNAHVRKAEGLDGGLFGSEAGGKAFRRERRFGTRVRNLFFREEAIHETIAKCGNRLVHATHLDDIDARSQACRLGNGHRWKCVWFGRTRREDGHLMVEGRCWIRIVSFGNMADCPLVRGPRYVTKARGRAIPTLE